MAVRQTLPEVLNSTINWSFLLSNMRKFPLKSSQAWWIHLAEVKSNPQFHELSLKVATVQSIVDQFKRCKITEQVSSGCSDALREAEII